MKKLMSTLCVVGTALALAACAAGSTSHHSGANHAAGRTAGDMGAPDTAPSAHTERVFKAAQTK